MEMSWTVERRRPPITDFLSKGLRQGPSGAKDLPLRKCLGSVLTCNRSFVRALPTRIPSLRKSDGNGRHYKSSSAELIIKRTAAIAPAIANIVPTVRFEVALFFELTIPYSMVIAANTGETTVES